MCGECCRDKAGRERRIRLTAADVRRVQESGVETAFCRKSGGTVGPYEYEMVKRGGSCLFLLDNKCSIYESRPLICRFYPFAMFKADSYVFKVDQDCEGVGQGKTVDKRYFMNLIRDISHSIGSVHQG